MKIKNIAISVSVAVASMAGVAPLAVASQHSVEKPNVIILFTDDMGWADIGLQGSKTPTPNLDKLANTGQRWTNFYVSSPISSPSRGGLLTGRLGPKTGLYGTTAPGVFIEGDPDGFPKSEVTIADSLKTNGYDTVMYGKWHLGSNADSFPTRHGFDWWYGIPASNDRYSTISPNQLKMNTLMKNNPKAAHDIWVKGMPAYILPKQEYWDVPLYMSYETKDTINGKYVDYKVPGGMKQATFTKDITGRAKDYIAEHKNQKNPFFMFMSYPQTHTPLFGSPEFVGKGHNRYGDILLEIDWSVGQIMDQLEKQGIADNTIVMFTSDNGPWWMWNKWGLAGQKGNLRDAKGTQYEGGMRVPFIVNWKGHLKNEVVDGIGSTLDILPTIMSLTGTHHPVKDLDGFDISKTWLKGDKSARTIMPYYVLGQFTAFRMGDYKVVFGERKGRKGVVWLNEPTLYNLKDDPNETTNLAKRSPKVLAEVVAAAKVFKENMPKSKAPLFNPNS
ncbi:sulfatase-like hydrolase/transferase [Vibrio ruber]|uniref:sulfatase-like hydrolase/transferase n=1 Tax=Vibrio ruber TaxID=184755 RepID=UPI002892A46E|nr:sulfatase-like hydrolase/transferase [Vibrio ruber]WNJ94292.1 sulfatase-like hydrolase/transferase [Vibrio ruber]